MNYVRTGMLMAGLTALFGAVGYLLGGGGGMLMALGSGMPVLTLATSRRSLHSISIQSQFASPRGWVRPSGVS